MNRYRFGPTPRCDVIGKLNLKPEFCSTEYKLAVESENNNVKPPKWDVASDSIEMLMIENEREHASLNKLHKAMLQHKKRVAKANIRRCHIMYGWQEKLRKRFIRVNGFMRDCMEKRLLAEQTAREQSALHQTFMKSINSFKKNIATLSAFRDDLKESIKELEPFKLQLDEVVKMSNIYQDRKDCMNRCDALMLAQVEISKMKQLKLGEIEEMRQQMIKVTNEASLTVLGLKTDLTQLERSYNNAFAMFHKQERLLEKAKRLLTERVSCDENTIIAVNFLYDLLRKRYDHWREPYTTNVVDQMCFIKTEIDILKTLLLEQESTDKDDDQSKDKAESAYC